MTMDTYFARMYTLDIIKEHLLNLKSEWICDSCISVNLN